MIIYFQKFIKQKVLSHPFEHYKIIYKNISFPIKLLLDPSNLKKN